MRENPVGSRRMSNEATHATGTRRTTKGDNMTTRKKTPTRTAREGKLSLAKRTLRDLSVSGADLKGGQKLGRATRLPSEACLLR